MQVLTDLNLSIKKAYISSDASWFMDGKKKPPKVLFLVLGIFVEASQTCFNVFSPYFLAVFHVTDQNGDKLTDESVISYIEQVVIISLHLII